MSPAARRLATQKLKIVSSPSPRRTPLRSPFIGIKTSRHGDTPGRTPTRRRDSEDGLKLRGTVLTDNLLNLPQRQRAADFFN